MGFNNPGAETLAQRLAAGRAAGHWPDHPVGMNLGKSKITPLEKAAEDYANSFRVLRPHLDFFVVNVSSPNTPNLRQLQDKGALDEILAAIQEVNESAESRAVNGSPDETLPPNPSSSKSLRTSRSKRSMKFSNWSRLVGLPASSRPTRRSRGRPRRMRTCSGSMPRPAD